MDRPLTAFQVDTDAKLSEITKSYRNEECLREVVSGPEESYIEVDIKLRNLKIYIYEDGAGIWGDGIDARFELPDYPDLKRLQQDLLRRCSDLL